jgi:HD-GYP domain-containing protein (c-di-GMP phosphodiesterase class II)
VTGPSGHPGGKPHHLILRERCADLGLPLWRFDASGRRTGAPAQGGAVGAWLRSPFVTRLVEGVVSRWVADDEPEPVELFPGARLIPVEDRERRRRLAISAALALGPEALGSEQFQAACRSAQLDEAATRRALEGIAAHAEAGAAQLTESIRWMNGDLALVGRLERTLDMMSRQLSESYEEMSLLYQLREYMNELDQPKRFVRQACFELHNVLPFRFIAARFVHDARRARTLEGASFVSGTLPCQLERFERFATGTLARLEPGRCLTLGGDGRGPLAVGASEVLAHPITRSGEVVGAFFAGDKAGEEQQITNIELKMIEAAAGYVSILLENSALYEEQHAMFLGALRALTAAIDAKDPYTCGHSERVATVAASLARAAGLPDQAVERIRVAGLVHDIGKIGIPESVLRKPGRLTDAEFASMKEHPRIGFNILRDIPQLADVLPGVLHHHERYDGGGYPSGLSGEQIPLLARIIALADAFDAMSSTRTYRASMTRADVLREIETNAGRQFDPALAQVFLSLDLTAYDRLIDDHREYMNPEGEREAAA